MFLLKNFLLKQCGFVPKSHQLLPCYHGHLQRSTYFNATHLAGQQELVAQGSAQALLPARAQEQGLLVPMGTEKEVQLVHKEN